MSLAMGFPKAAGHLDLLKEHLAINTRASFTKIKWMVWFNKLLAFHFTIVAGECMVDVGYHSSCVKETENISHLGCA